jgi:hypothetical protein
MNGAFGNYFRQVVLEGIRIPRFKMFNLLLQVGFNVSEGGGLEII